MKKSEGLRARAASLLEDARKINDDADGKPNGEERQKIANMFEEMDDVLEQAETQERFEGAAPRVSPEERGRRLPDVVEPSIDGDEPEVDIRTLRREQQAVRLAERDEYRDSFLRYVGLGEDALTVEDRQRLQEVRALTEGVDSDGGYLAPPQLIAGIVRDASDIEQLAPRMNTINASVRSIQQIKGVDTISFQWVAERARKPEDQPEFARDELFAHTAAVIVRVSDELLEDEQFNLESYISGLAAEAKVEGEEAAFVGGTGGTQPWGVLTRLNAEIGTPHRHTTANVGSITADDLLRALYSLKARHRRQATWVLGTQGILAARLLKAGDNYIWQPGIKDGQPDTILGFPVIEAYDGEHTESPLDNPVAAGNDIGFVGDLRRYTVLRRLQLQVKRLEELYAETDEIGLRFRFRTGGDVQNTAAFRTLRVKAA